MWIMSVKGFLSIVQDNKNSKLLQVRARIAEDIKAMFPNAKVYISSGGDYRYRAVISKDQFAVRLADHILHEVTYTSHFKDVAIRQSPSNAKRHSAYYACWNALAEMQDYAPYSRTPRGSSYNGGGSGYSGYSGYSYTPAKSTSTSTSTTGKTPGTPGYYPKAGTQTGTSTANTSYKAPTTKPQGTATGNPIAGVQGGKSSTTPTSKATELPSFSEAKALPGSPWREKSDKNDAKVGEKVSAALKEAYPDPDTMSDEELDEMIAMLSEDEKGSPFYSAAVLDAVEKAFGVDPDTLPEEALDDFVDQLDQMKQLPSPKYHSTEAAFWEDGDSEDAWDRKSYSEAKSLLGIVVDPYGDEVDDSSESPDLDPVKEEHRSKKRSTKPRYRNRSKIKGKSNRKQRPW